MSKKDKNKQSQAEPLQKPNVAVKRQLPVEPVQGQDINNKEKPSTSTVTNTGRRIVEIHKHHMDNDISDINRPPFDNKKYTDRTKALKTKIRAIRNASGNEERELSHPLSEQTRDKVQIGGVWHDSLVANSLLANKWDERKRAKNNDQKN